jgi:hypothetical protein
MKNIITRNIINSNVGYSRTKQKDYSNENFTSNKMFINLSKITSEILNFDGNVSEYNSELYQAAKYEALLLKNKQLNGVMKLFTEMIEIIGLYKQTHTTLNINNLIINFIDENYNKIKTELQTLKDKFLNKSLKVEINKINSFLYFQIEVDPIMGWYRFIKLINPEFNSIKSAINVMETYEDPRNILIKFLKYLDL